MDYLPPFPTDPHALKVVAIACVGSFLVQALSRPISGLLVPAYRSLKPADKTDWDVRVVAAVHAAIAAVLSVGIVFYPDAAVVADPVYGFSARAQTTYAISAGYFTWDLIVTVYYGWGAAFLAHALTAWAVYFFSLEPFLHGWGAVFLAYELSTPFMHMRFMCIMVKKADTAFFNAVNGLFALTFVGVRIIWGLPMTYLWWQQMFEYINAGKMHNYTLAGIYLFSNFVLTGLNVYWLFLMIKSLTKPRDAEPSKKAQ